MTEMSPHEIAKQALSSLDLTNLDDDCTKEDIEDLIRRAFTPHGRVAAICIWPKFVKPAKALIGNRVMPVCTVVNFPRGRTETAPVVAETRKAIQDGADEIDLVAPYRRLLTKQPEVMRSMVERVRDACDGAKLKVILETGVLADPVLIRQAADIAIAGGADFVKTCTGKVPGKATVSASRAILRAIRASEQPVGLKVAGGIRTIRGAGRHLAAARDVMGEGWATPERFRFGASGLLDELLTELNRK